MLKQRKRATPRNTKDVAPHLAGAFRAPSFGFPVHWVGQFSVSSDALFVSNFIISLSPHAPDQLQRAVERNEYGEAAHLIEAVQQLAAHFHSFVAIPKVAELSTRVATLQRAVQVRQPFQPS